MERVWQVLMRWKLVVNILKQVPCGRGWLDIARIKKKSLSTMVWFG
jgi:hypothetical protein